MRNLAEVFAEQSAGRRATHPLFVHGLKNKAQVLAGILRDATTAEMHRKQAEPGSSGST